MIADIQTVSIRTNLDTWQHSAIRVSRPIIVGNGILSNKVVSYQDSIFKQGRLMALM